MEELCSYSKIQASLLEYCFWWDDLTYGWNIDYLEKEMKKMFFKITQMEFISTWVFSQMWNNLVVCFDLT